MKKSTKPTIIVSITVLFLLTVTTFVLLYADNHRKGFLSQMDPEIKEEIHQKVSEMKEAEATPEEIHEEVTKILKAHGIDIPAEFGKGFMENDRHFMNKLSDEQREEIKGECKRLRENGASKEEVRKHAGKMLQGYGIEAPKHGKGGFGREAGLLMEKLNEEQRKELHNKIKEMRENDASRVEIRKEVGSMLEGYGVDMTEIAEEKLSRLQEHHDFELTETQKTEVLAKAQSMWESGATGKEIHEEIHGMLKGYGIELPEPKDGQFMHRQKHVEHIMSQLAKEQREAVKAKHKELREQGAKPKEIREEIRKMLEGYGIELPDFKNEHGNEKGNKQGNSMNKGNQKGKNKMTGSNYPNPFNPETTIEFTMYENAYATVGIYDIQGKLVRTLFKGDKGTGTHSITWNGKDENGNKVPSGTYFYKVQAGDELIAKQIILLE
ncbi:T9SS type A sorting domain-containing protein [bacterium]|nr:T9SS type A sorting domain-containing protein [bacterium]